MKKTWICSVALWIVCAFGIAGLWAYYVQIDFSEVFSGAADVFHSLLDSLSEYLGCAQGSIGVRGIRLVQMLFDYRKQGRSGSAAAVLIRTLKLLVIIPYIGVILVAIFAAFRRGWSYIASAVAASMGGLFLLGMTLVVLPVTLSQQVRVEAEKLTEDVADKEQISIIQGIANQIVGEDTVSAAVDGAQAVADGAREKLEGIFTPALFRKYIVRGLGYGWWICAGTLTILMLISGVGILFSTSEQRNSRREGEGILILAGELAGAVIPMEKGENIVIGSDPARCGLVLPGEKKTIQCVISRDEHVRMYHVFNASSRIMRCGEYMLPPGEVNRAKAGTQIEIPDSRCVLRVQ